MGEQESRMTLRRNFLASLAAPLLARAQSLNDLFVEDFPSNYMPEEYVERLAKSRVATISNRCGRRRCSMS